MNLMVLTLHYVMKGNIKIALLIPASNTFLLFPYSFTYPLSFILANMDKITFWILPSVIATCIGSNFSHDYKKIPETG